MIVAVTVAVTMVVALIVTLVYVGSSLSGWW